MTLYISDFTGDDAKAVCAWRYPIPYDVYDCPDWKTLSAQNWAMADESRRRSEFRSLKSDGYLAGFFRLVKRPECVMIGLGLAPETCGRGLGGQVLRMIMDVVHERYPGAAARLEVRTFNLRAVKCYEKAGFTIKKKYRRDTPTGPADFLLMEALLSWKSYAHAAGIIRFLRRFFLAVINAPYGDPRRAHFHMFFRLIYCV